MTHLRSFFVHYLTGIFLISRSLFVKELSYGNFK